MVEAQERSVEPAAAIGRPVSQIVLKVAGRCNLNCSYCYMYNSVDQTFRARPRFISDEVLDALFERIRTHCARRPGHAISLSLHGGEPTNIGVSRFVSLVTRAREALGDALAGIGMQTNGTLIDDEWARAILDLRVGVSVSLDGPAAIHDATRVDHAGLGSHDRVLRGLRQLQAVGLSPSVLCVVNPRLSGIEAYRYFRSIGVRRMDFLLPDVSHDNLDREYGGLGPTPVADYLLPILDAWMAEDDAEVRVRIFWNLLRQVLGGPGIIDSFGGTGSSYVVVETDGAIEANDALRVCEHGIASSGLNVLRNGFDDLDRGLPLLYRMLQGSIPIPLACTDCPERTICGGGYLPHRFGRGRGFDNPSVWCQDILTVIGRIRELVARDEQAREAAGAA